ncbi:hypothetical protein BDV24DRAFT_60044 [Aspergillus arachidicola]|uniref:Isochorismatase family protein family n=1 Tax=Aspergillus arachidicola TaxID=656916 RepID=A0A2G7FTN2_9EURO|nr:hypothetical protein BDV24DRAFT_60044 [Aspergillus arachidicola]PIG83988.1 isochorismatase family protein family [Aspergillus arachidicola]
MTYLSRLGNIPIIQTRKALLLLDFQNDFVRPSGALHVPNTAEFLETLPQLASAFRRTGEVIWVRTQFESCRPWIAPDEQEYVVLAPETANKRPRSDKPPGPTSVDPQAPVDEEAFLSSETSKCCRPQTPGAQFPAPILAAIDAESDTLVDKSDYSALQSQGLILSLRTRFVTELYLCGSLCNASVYATALDAVRHGFSVTLIEDCLGFRSFPRYEEAMRRMADIFGANGITTEELYEELDWQETDAIARKGGNRPVRNATSSGIEGVMDDLDVKPAKPAKPARLEEPEPIQRIPPPRGLDVSLGEDPLEDHDDILASVARTRYSRAAEKAQKARVKARRTQRVDSKTESTSRTESRRSTKSKPSPDIRKPGDAIGEGDSRIVYDLDLPANAFEQIRTEVSWQKMYHMSGEVPRLVAVQGQPLSDGSIPIYRHPADESPALQPFTATVDRVRMIVERILRHPLNHVLIQLYRDGQDRISEHSDKTLDIVRGSSICNVSLGAQRVMVLRSKAQSPEAEEGESSRATQRVPMPHESLFILGEKTNMRWLHGIRPDKRADTEKSMEERAYGGERISLTFRHIGTFLNPAGDTIWGQGAVSKSQDQANAVIHGDPAETERLIRAFGEENHAIDFDWDAVYGAGFDVVNFVTASANKLVAGEDVVANLRVLVCLSEHGMRYNLETPSSGKNTGPVYVDTDGTKISGDINILTHLTRRSTELNRPGVEPLGGGDRFTEIDEFLKSWREHQKEEKEGHLRALDTWERALVGKYYLNGPTFGLDDCALWPVLREIVQARGPFSMKAYRNLAQYYQRVENRGFVRKALEELR